MVQYTAAPAVGTMIRTIVEASHPRLAGLRVDAMFSDPPPTSRGKKLAGKVQVVSGLAALYAGPRMAVGEYYSPAPFFLLTLHHPRWNGNPEKWRAALIDHLLTCCEAEEDENGVAKLSLRHYDVQEFREVVERHGLWHEGLETFVTKAHELQTVMNLMTDDEPSPVASRG